MDEKGSFSSWSRFQLCLFSRLWASPHIPCEFKCNFYVKPSKANLNSKRWISELLLHNNGQFIVTNSRLLVPTPSSKVKHLVFIKKTSKELQRLSRSFSDCQSHTLNVKIRVFNLLGKVNCVTKSLYSSLWSSHPFDQGHHQLSG